MSTRNAVGFPPPTQAGDTHTIDEVEWTWNGSYWVQTGSTGSGGGSSYDDTEIRGLIAANTAAISDNATDISGNSDRITTLENSSGGTVDAYTKAESDAKYVPKSGNTTISGTLTATDFVAS